MRFSIWPAAIQSWDDLYEITTHCGTSVTYRHPAVLASAEPAGPGPGTAAAADRRRQPGRPVMVGTPAEVTDIVGRYREAGAGELIISPRSARGRAGRRPVTC